MSKISIKELMQESGVAFGTSGARGLVSSMTDRVCMAYATAFLQHLDQNGAPGPRVLLVGGDRRPSSPRIMTAVAQAAKNHGYEVKSGGLIPSPALALWGMQLGVPTVMVTGSHIPDDRNGLKFTTAQGEITKQDEAAIRSQEVPAPQGVNQEGMLEAPDPLPETDPQPAQLYLNRYRSAFGENALRGLRLGVYGHSAVGRQLLVELYEGLGAEIVSLGFSDTFIPVDTEAIRPEDDTLAAAWAKQHDLSAILSTDGDSDRPLFSDENGIWLRGDITGILCAHFLGADAVALPVSCNTALEKSQWFKAIQRTKIGSPFVIEAMEELARTDDLRVVGYEANGGFFTQSTIEPTQRNGLAGPLPALPTRDPVIVHLSMLMLAQKKQCPVSALRDLVPARVTASGRDQSFSKERSSALIARLSNSSNEQLADLLGLGRVTNLDQTDGLRLTFASDEILHLRPSGNAPELRCYAESNTVERSNELVQTGLNVARSLSET